MVPAASKVCAGLERARGGTLPARSRCHYARLAESARILMMALPHTTAELCELSVELCVRNGFRTDVYLRPFAYKANEDIGVRLHACAMPSAWSQSLRALFRKRPRITRRRELVAAHRRHDAPARGKITGIYVNSALAKSEAVLNGFDEAIMLTADGHVSEGSPRTSSWCGAACSIRPIPRRISSRGDAPRDHDAGPGRARADRRRARDRSQRADGRDELFITGQRGRHPVDQLARSSADRRRRTRPHFVALSRPLRTARCAARCRAIATG